MTRTRGTSERKTMPVLLAFAAALTIALVGSVSGTPTAHAQAATATARGEVSGKALAFRNEMRKLWEDHITWTRLAIVSFAADLPDLQPTETRLLANQADIGNAIKPFYGAAAGRALTKLLREHILGAVDLLVAVKGGDQAKIASAQRSWSANGDAIAAFLTKANPRNWPLSMTRQMMRTHLKLTGEEGVAQLQGHYPASIAAYDSVHREILQMADMLSTGIIRQFQARFR